MDWVYLDNNATTRPADEVVDAMLPFLRDRYGNPSSVHDFGGQVRAAVEEARGQLAELLGCDAGEMVFTSGGTESDNMAVRGLLAARQPRQHIVLSAVEHAAVWELAEWLERSDFQVTRVGVDRAGRLDLDALGRAVSPDRTALVAVMHANNETGVIFPIEQVAAVCRRNGVPLVCDAVQSFGKVPLDVRAMRAELLSLSAHKFHGPKGVGLLYVRRGTRFRPWLIGHQERRRRGGTENVAGIIGMAAAARLAVANLYAEARQVAALRDRLEAGLLATVPEAVVNGGAPDVPRLPNTGHVSFIGCQSEALLLMLSEAGIAASSGAACSSGSLEASHVLKAMGVPPAVAQGAIRFSLSRYTAADEIQRVLDVMPPLVQRLRALRV